MPWPWRKRREPARHALPRQAASWAEPAFPPAPASLAPAAAPAVAPAPAPAPTVGVPVQTTGVMLGFADGSNLALDEGDPRAAALRAVADVLISRPNT